MGTRRTWLAVLVSSVVSGFVFVACSGGDDDGTPAPDDLSDAGHGIDSRSSDASAGDVTQPELDAEQEEDSGGGEAGDGGGKAFMKKCQNVGSPGDCAEGLICKYFKPMNAKYCTKTCTTKSDCPSPSTGCTSSHNGGMVCTPPS
jgi:hypothetical protein